MRSPAADLELHAGEESGFTLVELLVVMVVVGVLIGISVVSYLSFRDHSSRVAAQANVRTIMPALEAYHADQDTYVGATLTELRTQYDLQIDDSAASHYKISAQTDTSFCAQSHVGDWYAWTTGPAAPISTDSSAHC
ncbi:MAG: prepilin-type N-terminal cleavage/methylation domain-containing protein [Gaiellaceae bacterium]|jgi:prepilin-type N-terminal cleavage/methylation domain-containing protein